VFAIKWPTCKRRVDNTFTQGAISREGATKSLVTRSLVNPAFYESE